MVMRFQQYSNTIRQQEKSYYHLLLICGQPVLTDETDSPSVHAFSYLLKHIPSNRADK